MIQKVANEFKVTPVQGVLSHEMTRHVIDGDKVILNKPDVENKVDEVEFEVGQVYAMDIVMSTGEGKAKESEQRTTIYKRAVDQQYSLRMKASRAVFSQIQKRFSTYPFTLRALDEKTARFGIVELSNHNLVDAYPVLHEEEGEFVAHIKFTCLIMHNSSSRITGDDLINAENLQSEHSVTDPGLLGILALGKGKKKKRGKKKKKKKTKSN